MQPNQRERLTILHTNDIHSHFATMSSIAALVQMERARAEDDSLVLLDIGDHMDRMAVETEGTMGAANTDILNLTGYDCITIGNNEGLTFTPEQLGNAYAGLLCPVVCCNIREQGSGEVPTWMKKHVIIEKKGIKIGIVGATAPFDIFYRLLGWRALDPIAAIQEEIQVLRPQVDVLIVLSHLGLTSDQRLAEQLSGIDVILGGHTHHLLEEPLFIGNTAVCGAGKFGMYVGKVIIERQENNVFKVISGECVPVDGSLLDEEVARGLVIHREKAVELLNETIAITDRELTLDYGDTEDESPFANFLAQSIRHFTNSELAIVNSGQLLESLPQGEISTGLLHRICPSPINPCVIQLLGRDLRLTLEESLLTEYRQKKIIGFGFRGKVLGNLAVDGLDVIYDPQGSDYHKIIAITINGEALQDDRSYAVGTLDMFTFRIGYEKIADGQSPVFILPEFLRDLLRFELLRPGSMDECFVARWHQSDATIM